MTELEKVHFFGIALYIKLFCHLSSVKQISNVGENNDNCENSDDTPLDDDDDGADWLCALTLLLRHLTLVGFKHSIICTLCCSSSSSCTSSEILPLLVSNTRLNVFLSAPHHHNCHQDDHDHHHHNDCVHCFNSCLPWCVSITRTRGSRT